MIFIYVYHWCNQLSISSNNINDLKDDSYYDFEISLYEKYKDRVFNKDILVYDEILNKVKKYFVLK